MTKKIVILLASVFFAVEASQAKSLACMQILGNKLDLEARISLYKNSSTDFVKLVPIFEDSSLPMDVRMNALEGYIGSLNRLNKKTWSNIKELDEIYLNSDYLIENRVSAFKKALKLQIRHEQPYNPNRNTLASRASNMLMTFLRTLAPEEQRFLLSNNDIFFINGVYQDEKPLAGLFFKELVERNVIELIEKTTFFSIIGTDYKSIVNYLKVGPHIGGFDTPFIGVGLALLKAVKKSGGSLQQPLSRLMSIGFKLEGSRIYWRGLRRNESLLRAAIDIGLPYEDIETLLNFDSKPNFIDEVIGDFHAIEIDTPLAAAVRRGDIDIIQLLITHGVDIDDEAIKLIVVKAALESSDTMKALKLVEGIGIDINVDFGNGNSALHYLASLNNSSMEDMTYLENELKGSSTFRSGNKFFQTPAEIGLATSKTPEEFSYYMEKMDYKWSEMGANSTVNIYLQSVLSLIRNLRANRINYFGGEENIYERPDPVMVYIHNMIDYICRHFDVNLSHNRLELTFFKNDLKDILDYSLGEYHKSEDIIHIKNLASLFTVIDQFKGSKVYIDDVLQRVESLKSSPNNQAINDLKMNARKTLTSWRISPSSRPSLVRKIMDRFF